jgi:tetratricopeptide (TPR) repeat protein
MHPDIHRLTHVFSKTRMALSYVCQFTNATSKPDDRTDTVDKRHILWVSMEDQQTILQGYREIANKTGAGHGVIHDAAADLVSHIERWLQNPDNGQWILVLDNFCDDSLTFPDHAHRMDRINLEKIQHHGQILITTRRRDFNIKLLNELRPEVIPLSPPSLGIRLRIYKHFIDTSLFSLTEPGNEGRLLGYLTFPKLIIDAVQHMNTKNISPKTLLQGMQTEGFRKVQDFSGDMMWYLLKHLLSQPLRPEEEDWPYEIEILFMLAMFGREGASLDFLRNGIDEESAKVLDQALGTLQNSFLVERRDDTSEMYCVNQTVQATLLAWTEEPEWRAIMFRRLDLMLSTIYENYNLKVSEDMSIIFTLRKDLFSQLERLLTFMKPDARESSASYDGAIELTPRAVQGIIEFSRLLCDQDRYEEATDVLDFAREHYPVDELSRDGPVDDDSLPKLDIWYNLDQQRMWSYLLRPAPWEDELGSWTDRNWTEAEYIVRAQIEKVDSWENPRNEFWILNRRWELSLDLVRVCCYLKQWGRVEEALKSTDRVNIAIRPNDRKDMPTFTDMEGVRRIIDEAGNRGMKRPKEREGLRREDALRKLAAKRKLEQGLFYRERGLHEEACGNKSEAVSSWKSAREALRIAEVALREWSPKDERYEEVLVYIAEANTRLGARGDFKEAYNTFERALRRTEKNYGSHCKHAWDMECRMNAVKLRTGQDLKTAVSSLTSLFAKYKDRFGEKAAATVRCFYQLEEAYIKSGQWDEASALSMQMGIKPRLQERYNTYWTVSGAVIILCGVCSLWMVRCPGNVLHLWLRNGAGSTP